MTHHTVAARYLQAYYRRTRRPYGPPENPGCPDEQYKDIFPDFRREVVDFCKKQIIPVLKQRGWQVSELEVSNDLDEFMGDGITVIITVSAKAGQKISLGGRRYVVLDQNLDPDMDFMVAPKMFPVEIEDSVQFDVDDIEDYTYEANCPGDTISHLIGLKDHSPDKQGVEKLVEEFDRLWLRWVRSKVQKKADTAPSALRIASRYLEAGGNPLMLRPDYGQTDEGSNRGDDTDFHKEAYNPPFWNAAQADEALGEAYRKLVDLKLGFDSWEEIPRSAQPLYNEIMKAMDAVGKARKDTYQVRMMVQRKKYGGDAPRTAFNKYNPDELLMALVDILEKYELDDVAGEVKKLTPMIQRAWRSRERVASEKVAAVQPGQLVEIIGKDLQPGIVGQIGEVLMADKRRDNVAVKTPKGDIMVGFANVKPFVWKSGMRVKVIGKKLLPGVKGAKGKVLTYDRRARTVFLELENGENVMMGPTDIALL